jgi:hypothetical protein
MTDFEGVIIHELSDTSDPNTHCSGFHGSASTGSDFFLACDEVHGGIVVVSFDPASETYTSRAISYPDEGFEGFRVGSFAYHYENPVVVGAFSLRDGTEFHMLALTQDATAIEQQNILTLPGELAQCAYQFEVGHGHDLLVLMPDGVLHVFEVTDGATFTPIASKEVVPGMVACSEAVFVAGIGQAFIATPATQTLYAVDLTHIDDGEMEVFTTKLPFTPTAMTVSGFSLDTACEGHSHGESPPAGALQALNPVGLAAGFFLMVLNIML